MHTFKKGYSIDLSIALTLSSKLSEHDSVVWLGTVTREDIRRPLNWFNLLQESGDYIQPRELLAGALGGVELRIVTRTDAQTPAQMVWDHKIILAAARDYKSQI